MRRTRKAKDTRRTERVQALVTPEEAKAIRRRAGAETVSTYIRNLLIREGVIK